MRYPNLERVVKLVARAYGSKLPSRLIAIGHSGAYRTLLYWLRHPRLQHVILLDSLYAGSSRFRRWLTKNPRVRMTSVVRGTWRMSKALSKRLRNPVWCDRIPRFSKKLAPKCSQARVLFLWSQYSHLGIVTSGRAIPQVLRDRLSEPSGPFVSRNAGNSPENRLTP